MTEFYTIAVKQAGHPSSEPVFLAARIEDALAMAANLAAYSFDDEQVPADVWEAIQAPGVVALPYDHVLEITAITEDAVRHELMCDHCGGGGIVIGSAGYAHCPIGGEWCGEDIALMTPDELVERWAG